MVNHGISTGALFLLVGVIYDRRHTREVDEFGGLAKVMPFYAAVFLIVTFASIGLPGTNGFIGEFLVIIGAFPPSDSADSPGSTPCGAAAGVILAAVYMLSVDPEDVLRPAQKPEEQAPRPDLTGRETLALAPLVVMIFVIGFYPTLFLDRMIGLSCRRSTSTTKTVWAEPSTRTNRPRLLADTSFRAAERGAPPVQKAKR